MDNSGFWYLASTFTVHPGGPDGAFRMACREAGRLLNDGIVCYSPIAHTEAIRRAEVRLNKLSHQDWMDADEPFCRAARGLIVLMSEDWTKSKGIAMEIEWFKEMGKPIHYIVEWETPKELAGA